MNKITKRLFWGIIVLLILFLSIWYFTRPKPVTVALYTVSKGKVEKTVANTRVGTVKACRRSMVAPGVGGEVSNLLVKEGDSVDEGQKLLELWNDDLKAKLKLAEAEKLSAKARVEELCRIASGAKRELKRVKRLSKDNMISEELVDKAQTEFEATSAACEGAKAQINVSDAQIEVTRAALERTIIRAPFKGIVAEARTVEVEVVIVDPKDLEGLLPGYSADIEIYLDVRTDVLRIPTEAVLEGYRVYLYNPETSSISERKFEPGIANWNYTEVKSGLEAGDKIVLSVGREDVKPGIKVIPELNGENSPLL